MENKLRTFVAIELDQDIKGAINSFETGLTLKGCQGLRWVKPEQIHLTLKFLGDIDHSQVEKVILAISGVANQNDSFPLMLENPGVFPDWRNPRTLWIGIKESQALRNLFQQMDAALTNLGFSPEGKKFSPHLTLCRVSDFFDLRMAQPLQKEIESFSTVLIPPWIVKEIVFFRSQLLPGGPIYTPISRQPLKITQKM